MAVLQAECDAVKYRSTYRFDGFTLTSEPLFCFHANRSYVLMVSSVDAQKYFPRESGVIYLCGAIRCARPGPNVLA